MRVDRRPQQAPLLLARLGMMDASEGDALTLRSTAPRVRLNRDCCRRAFLRGALLGLWNDHQPRTRLPSGACRTRRTAGVERGQTPAKPRQAWCTVSNAAVPLASTANKATRYPIFSPATGAHQTVTRLESLRVQRQVLGTVNRAMNCDSANLQKQMNASQRQPRSDA